jgi:hypothetical protein
MKAHQYALVHSSEGEETGQKIRRNSSILDSSHVQRIYGDTCDMPAEKRKTLIRQCADFQDRLCNIYRAMSDFFAGQQFFDFQIGDLEAAESKAINGKY